MRLVAALQSLQSGEGVAKRLTLVRRSRSIALEFAHLMPHCCEGHFYALLEFRGIEFQQRSKVLLPPILDRAPGRSVAYEQ